ncbi:MULTISPECIES: GAP family protein [unclassified Agromyces]|uniref:GAP family protein n=1 Tax=unclassified Agromyces TaxID=2639701 RepID=UPI00301580F4
MTPALLLGVAGLAALDALNPATIVSVALILLAAPRRPGLTALATVSGAALTVFAVGAALYVTAGAAAGAVDGVVTALRFLAFGAAAVGLVVSGVRRLRDRPRRPVALPDWFGPRTAIAFGVVVTAADLPNAFPYFVAIERLVDSGAETWQGFLVLAGYTLVYCLPCLVLLVVGLLARDRTRARLQGLVARFGSGTVRSSVPIAVLLVLSGIAVASIPFLLA